MYQYKHASTGLRPKQVTIVIPTCPICGKPMDSGRQRVVATVRRKNRKREYIHSWTSFEICAEHSIPDAGMWFQPFNIQLGIIVEPQLSSELS